MAGIDRRQTTPWHLWLVGVMSLLWNGFGAFDFTMTITRGAEYLRSMGSDEAMIRWFETVPSWLYVLWGLGVWGGVIAAVFLLLRRRRAVTAYGLSLLGAVGSTLSQKLGLVGSVPDVEGPLSSMPFIIIGLALVQLFYAAHLAKRSVLI